MHLYEETSTRKLVLAGLLVFLTLFYYAGYFGGTFSVSAAPYELKIYLGPSRVLADNIVDDIIFVQLEDSTYGKPVRAPVDTIILLSSSRTNIGTVDSSILVPAGSTGASARFTSTYTPGSTTITAFASGYATDEAVITTVGPLPSALAIYALPQFLPADGNSYSAVRVQLQDSSGSPAKAPVGNVRVSLYSSNTTIVTVDPNVVITSGTTFAIASVRTVFNATGPATITASASGYSSGQTTVSTQMPTSEPSKLQVYVAPARVQADGTASQQVAVELFDSNGTLAQTSSNLAVTLFSSATDVGTTDSTITIPKDKCYALASFASTLKSGTTSILAVATNYVPGQASITTVGSVASKLAVFGMPSRLPANQQSYDAFVVQLQDSQGNPAKDPAGPTVVNLFSSDLNAGNVSSTLAIPFGQTKATGTIRTTLATGSTTISAQKSGYETGQTIITTYFTDQPALNLQVTANPTTADPGKSFDLTAYVTLDDNTPVPGATVRFASSNGTFQQPTDEGNGYYRAVFTPPSISTTTSFLIVVNASKFPSYMNASLTLQVTVNSISFSVTAIPNRIDDSEISNITAYVTYANQTPVVGAVVRFATDKGATLSAVVEEGNGYYRSVFTPPKLPSFSTVNFTITSNASIPGNQVNGSTLILPVTSSVIYEKGTIQLRVLDQDGNPVNQAVISSTSQPAGMIQLNGNTNPTGYMVFTDATSGSYTFQITKTGYDTKSVTIILAANQTATSEVTLTTQEQPFSDQTLIILIAIAAIIIVAIVIIAFASRKRPRKSTDDDISAPLHSVSISDL